MSSTVKTTLHPVSYYWADLSGHSFEVLHKRSLIMSASQEDNVVIEPFLPGPAMAKAYVDMYKKCPRQLCNFDIPPLRSITTKADYQAALEEMQETFNERPPTPTVINKLSAIGCSTPATYKEALAILDNVTMEQFNKLKDYERNNKPITAAQRRTLFNLVREGKCTWSEDAINKSSIAEASAELRVS